MGRVYNFSAGPAVLPEEVLREAADEMLDYRGSGMSVMEMSHRSMVFDEIIKDAEKDLRDLLNIPDNYKVLFLQGGASTTFAMVPMLILLLQVSGLRRLTKKLANMVRLILLHHQQTRHFHIFLTAQIFQSAKMPTMYISVRIIQSMERSTKNFRIRKARRWLQMYLPVSCQSLTM